ncbi:VOC family protein [Burkholderia orbicola]|uniref:Glyoxalase n=1 Tax=Burkholderia cenocepacia TaxID=95486 RepID=A0A3R9CF03_9BURK|nr:glyoxalase [Burkholderia cenocepacia]RSC12784.1 glyoxalase [Burkholderia cenocepacia]
MKSVRSVLLAAMLAGGLAVAPVTFAKPPVPPVAVPTVAVGPQYDTTHVCVAPEDFDRFTDSFVATFGGKKSKQGVFQVTPTPSQTMSQLVLTPVGTISVFGFKTPIPYPFCEERTGYLVTDMDVAVKSAREHGADVIVDTFPDPIGRDAIITWAGGVNMQLYWHTQAPNYDALQTIPENRVYVSPQSVRKFVHDFVKFSKGKVVSDNLKAPGIEIGRPDDTYRRIRIESGFGKMTVLVTDGHLPYPFGREMTGYEVPDLAATLKQAEAAGVTVLVPPFKSDDRDAALVQFPGGYVAEIHASAAR